MPTGLLFLLARLLLWQVLELLVLCHEHWPALLSTFYKGGMPEPASPVARIDLSFALRTVLLPPTLLSTKPLETAPGASPFVQLLWSDGTADTCSRDTLQEFLK
jgi:hypothetical protein